MTVCLSVCFLTVYLSICLASFYLLPLCLSCHLSICLSVPFCLFVCLSVFLSIRLSVFLSIRPSSACPSVSLPVYVCQLYCMYSSLYVSCLLLVLSVHLSLGPFVCLSFWLSVCLSLALFISASLNSWMQWGKLSVKAHWLQSSTHIRFTPKEVVEKHKVTKTIFLYLYHKKLVTDLTLMCRRNIFIAEVVNKWRCYRNPWP